MTITPVEDAQLTKALHTDDEMEADMVFLDMEREEIEQWLALTMFFIFEGMMSVRLFRNHVSRWGYTDIDLVLLAVTYAVLLPALESTRPKRVAKQVDDMPDILCRCSAKQGDPG